MSSENVQQAELLYKGLERLASSRENDPSKLSQDNAEFFLATTFSILALDLPCGVKALLWGAELIEQPRLRQQMAEKFLELHQDASAVDFEGTFSRLEIIARLFPDQVMPDAFGGAQQTPFALSFRKAVSECFYREAGMQNTDGLNALKEDLPPSRLKTLLQDIYKGLEPPPALA